MSRTHRCIDCPQAVEHEPEELCPSCGRCDKHCHGVPEPRHKSEHRPMRTIDPPEE